MILSTRRWLGDILVSLAGLRGLFLLSFILLRAEAQEQQAISLHYFDRPPLIVVDAKGHVGGLLAEPIEKVVELSQVPVQWVKTPFSKSSQIIKANSGQDCTFGWYKTAERESFARFSLPYFLDKPPAGLVRADFAQQGWSNAGELLSRPDIKLTLRENIAYGDYIDRLIAKLPAGQVRILNTDSSAIAKMIHGRQTDLTIVPMEEVGQVIAGAGLTPADFRVLFFADVPKQDFRYIACSKQVPLQVMQRFDKAIKELKLP